MARYQYIIKSLANASTLTTQSRKVSLRLNVLHSLAYSLQGHILTGLAKRGGSLHTITKDRSGGPHCQGPSEAGRESMLQSIENRTGPFSVLLLCITSLQKSLMNKQMNKHQEEFFPIRITHHQQEYLRPSPTWKMQEGLVGKGENSLISLIS